MSDEATFEPLYERWARAVAERDRGALEELFDPGYTYTSPDGQRMSREEILAVEMDVPPPGLPFRDSASRRSAMSRSCVAGIRCRANSRAVTSDPNWRRGSPPASRSRSPPSGGGAPRAGVSSPTMRMSSPTTSPRSIAAFGAGLRAGDFTAAEMTERALAAAERSQATINAFITITGELARAQALAADRALAAGEDAGPLLGVPVAIKDLIDVAGVPSTAGSRSLAGNVAARDADVVARLVAGGAVIVGKANMDQFAFGPHQDDYGRTNCPADTSRYAGGSSGGSAAAVAAGCVLAALGTDAGGSTRFPAACCGVAGFKPTFGRLPAGGIAPAFWSLDHVGPIARGVEDVKALFAVLGGGRAAPRTHPPRIATLAGWRDGCEPAVVAALDRALAAAAAAGAGVLEARAIEGLDGWSRMLMATVGPRPRLRSRRMTRRASRTRCERSSTRAGPRRRPTTSSRSTIGARCGRRSTPRWRASTHSRCRPA